jgi:hypothetical protein
MTSGSSRSPVKARSYRLESAELKKKALVEFAAPRRVKELEAEVAKARIDELTKKADWEMIRAQLERLQKAAAAPQPQPPTDGRRHLFALVSRAIAFERQIRQELEPFTRETKSDLTLQKEIRDLTNQLGIIVEEAEGTKAASDFAGLKARIQQAARR